MPAKLTKRNCINKINNSFGEREIETKYSRDIHKLHYLKGQ